MKRKKLGIICLAGLLMTTGLALTACKDPNNSGNSSSESTAEIIDNRTISINKTELTLTRGESETLTAQLSVGKGDFTWTSSNEAVATVSQSGEVCAVEVGTATITVTYEDVTATCTVTVELPDYVPVFKNAEQSIPLWVGNSYPIDATVTFGGEEVAANVSYVSQDPSVVTVDENGVVQGVGIGETTVTVTAEYFGLIEQMVVDVTVTEPIIIRANAQTLELDTITDENVGFSKEGALSIEVFNQQENITNDLTYAWEVVGESIVQIEADGANLAVVATGIGETKVKVGFTFNGQEYENVFSVTVNRAMYGISDMVAEDYSGQIVMALPEGISITETPETITFGDNEATFVSMNDGNIVLEKGTFDYSEYEVCIEVGNYGYVAKSVTYCTKILVQEDVKNFKRLLKETSDGYFLFGEDLNFGGAELKGYIETFSGTLDGNGFALKNFKNGYAEEDWVGYFIEENMGTIKNLSLQFTFAVANVEQDAFIYKNSGTIENVKMDVIYAFENDCWNPGSLVGKNYGTIRNIVAVMDMTSDVICAKVGCMIGANYATGIVENCYVVNNGLVVSGAEDGIWIENVSGSKANCTAYSTMAELAAVADLSSANGWNEYWSIEDSMVYFGDEGIVEEEPETVITLTQADAENFVSLLAATPNGHFVLGSDIDFNGTKLAGEIEFSGTLDGRGYALKNFEINYEASDGTDGVWESYLIEKNTGTIKNLSIDYVLGTASSDQNAFIAHNEGIIENVKVSVIFKAYGWITAPLAGTNKGTIKNVVIVMDKTNDFTELSRIGGIVGSDYNGTMQNCYVVHNGIMTGAEDRMYLETWNYGTKENCTSYATMAELAAAADLSTANGWSDAWKIESGVVLFGEEEIVVEETLQLTSESKDVSLYIGESLEEGQTSVVTVTVALSVNGVDATSEASYSWVAENANVSVAGNGATAEITAVTAGTATVTVTAERNGKTATYTFNVTVTLVEAEEPETVITLTQVDAENFVSLLAATPNGHFVLGSDIDFNGAKLAGQITFSGTLDGNGYALKNFEINAQKANDEDDVLDCFLFEKNTGTIKNLLIDYTLKGNANNPNALIVHNEGVIENVKVNVVFKDYGWITAPLAGTNKGTIKNVVIVMDKTNDFTELSRIGGIVGSDYNGTMQNCYVVHNGIMTGAEDRMYLETWNYGTKENCTSYAMMAELAAAADLSTANGWSSYWKIEEGVVLFGEEEIVVEETLQLTSESKDVSLYIGESLEEGQTSVVTVTVALSVNGVDATSEASYSWVAENANVSVAGNGATAEITAVTAGTATVTVTAERNGKTATYTFNVTVTLVETPEEPESVITLTQADAENFVSLLAATPNGHFVLGSDIDFNGAKLAGQITFSGTLDGRGYALKNFELNDGSIGETYLFMENSGTIKNISIQYVLGTASENSTINSDGRNLTGLIRKNTGIVENAKFDVTYNNYGWDTGAIAGANAGTIQNCVVVIRLGTITEKSRIGVAGCDDNGTYKNNYIVHNGILDGREGNAILYAETFGNGTYENNYAYSTMAELAVAADLSTANGWSDAWKIESGVVLFGEEEIVEDTPSEEPETVITLTQVDAENFVSLLAATPNGHFVLGSDIDFNGAKLAGQITFSGTLDGNGYALKNFELNDGGIGETYLFMENSGTIKNISIQYVLGTASENSTVNSDGRNLTGLIRKNTGTVENAKFDVTYNNYGWDTGAIAGANAGTIQNCVVVIRLGTITEKSRIGVAGCDDNGTYKNNYIVHNGILDGRDGNAILYAETFGNGTYENNYAYSTMAELAAAADLSTASGWSEYWSIADNTVTLTHKE